MSKAIRIALKGAAWYWPCRLSDSLINRRRATADKRILIVRHSGKQPYRFGYFLDWIQQEFPAIRARLELRLLPCRIRDFSPYVLHVPWLQDPVAEWTPRGYRQAMELAAQCEARGIPVLNPVDRTAHSIKSECTQRIARAGVRTPRIVPIGDVKGFRESLGGLEFPLLIREDRGHGLPAYLVESLADLDRVPIGRFAHPIASEYIDVRSSDGLYRKYRYLAAGSGGVTRHLMIGSHWEVRPDNRVRTDSMRAEELAYLEAPEPNYAALERARQALEFAVAAFDYSYDRQGRLVVWEANPYPDLSYPKHPTQRYTFPYVQRSYAAIVRLYLEMAGLPVPRKLDEMLAGQAPATSREAA
jgi:hypothetical protein